MQTKTEINYVASLGKYFITCGHTETEKITDNEARRRKCCPDVGEYYRSRDNRKQCKKGVTHYEEWSVKTLVVHLPDDATTEEKILLTYQQIEKVRQRAGGKIFFEKGQIWKHVEDGKNRLNKNDKKKIEIVLFRKELPPDLKALENQYYQKLIKKLPAEIIGIYANTLVNLNRFAV